jgi:hypothetical protein
MERLRRTCPSRPVFERHEQYSRAGMPRADPIAMCKHSRIVVSRVLALGLMASLCGLPVASASATKVRMNEQGAIVTQDFRGDVVLLSDVVKK